MAHASFYMDPPPFLRVESNAVAIGIKSEILVAACSTWSEPSQFLPLNWANDAEVLSPTIESGVNG